MIGTHHFRIGDSSAQAFIRRAQRAEQGARGVFACSPRGAQCQSRSLGPLALLRPGACAIAVPHVRGADRVPRQAALAGEGEREEMGFGGEPQPRVLGWPGEFEEGNKGLSVERLIF